MSEKNFDFGTQTERMLNLCSLHGLEVERVYNSFQYLKKTMTQDVFIADYLESQIKMLTFKATDKLPGE